MRQSLTRSLILSLAGLTDDLQTSNKGKISLDSLLPNNGASMQAGLVDRLMRSASSATTLMTSLEDRYCTPGTFFAGTRRKMRQDFYQACNAYC